MWLKEGLDDIPLSESEYAKVEAYCLGIRYDLLKSTKISSYALSAQPIAPVKEACGHEEKSADVLWRNIINKIIQSPNEIQTISQIGIKGKWICINIFIDGAKNNTPSSSTALIRTISKNEFAKLYPLFYQWRSKNITRKEAKGGSMNSSYIFALINEFDK